MFTPCVYGIVIKTYTTFGFVVSASHPAVVQPHCAESGTTPLSGSRPASFISTSFVATLSDKWECIGEFLGQFHNLSRLGPKLDLLVRTWT